MAATTRTLPTLSTGKDDRQHLKAQDLLEPFARRIVYMVVTGQPERARSALTDMEAAWRIRDPAIRSPCDVPLDEFLSPRLASMLQTKLGLATLGDTLALTEEVFLSQHRLGVEAWREFVTSRTQCLLDIATAAVTRLQQQGGQA